MFGLKLSFGEQLRSDPALEQHPLSGHLHQDETHQLTHVHTTDHLLKPTTQRKRRKVSETLLNILSLDFFQNILSIHAAISVFGSLFLLLFHSEEDFNVQTPLASRWR